MKENKKELERQEQARIKVGMPKDIGKSYKDYVKQAAGRKEDNVYKNFIDRKYKPAPSDYISFEKELCKELKEE